MIVLQSLKRLTAKVKLEAVRFPMAHRLGGSGAPEARENCYLSCNTKEDVHFDVMF